MKRLIALSAVAVAVALIAAPAAVRAATNTGTLDVSATVVTSCQISAGALGFGDYTGAQNDSSATVTVTCNTASVPFTVALGAGGNWTGATRQMANGTARLSYTLYTDGARTNLWEGLTTMAGTTTAAAPSTDSSLVVYGSIPANQIVTTTGLYTDSVVMTLTF